MSQAAREGDAPVRASVEAARQLAGAARALRAVTAAKAQWPAAGQLEQLFSTSGGSLRRAQRAWAAVPPPLRGDLRAPDIIRLYGVCSTNAWRLPSLGSRMRACFPGNGRP
jgi:hypothetical protein